MVAESLHLVPSLKALPDGDGRVVLTRKFLQGIEGYAQHWRGPIVVHMVKSDSPDSNLDHERLAIDDLPFTFHWHEPGDARSIERLADAGVVLVTLVDRNLDLHATCARINVPLVFISEYSVTTRRQIVRSETSNPILRWRRERWTTQLESRYEQAVREATGIQCNGTPTYEAYRSINPNALLYFDTRVKTSMLAAPEVVEARCEHLNRDLPLRLAFSGRLIAMKGADHLPRLAERLRARNVPFTLDICGDGPLRTNVQQMIDRAGLQDVVHLRGVLDFETELLPFVSNEVDLFICCHLQGDPSCTYLETLSCGTPIVGYDNEACRGVIEASNAGWTTPRGDPEALADRIELLHRDRALLRDAAHAARSFASKHTFEDTMRRRVEHLVECRALCGKAVAS